MGDLMAQLFFPAETQKAALIGWAVKRLPRAGRLTPEMSTPIGIVDGSGRRLLAVAIFHDYLREYGQIELTAVSAAHPARWCCSEIIAGLLHYPFRQAEARKLVCHIEVGNVPAERFAAGAGLTKEAVLRHHFAHKHHAGVWSMMAGEYDRSRWAIPRETEQAA